MADGNLPPIATRPVCLDSPDPAPDSAFIRINISRSPPMTNNEAVIQFITSLQWGDVPPAVRHQTKRCLLDCLGALIAGYRAPVTELMVDLAREQLAGDQATLPVKGITTSNTGAALVNGFAGNAFDIDDGLREIKGHPGACTLPVLLAVFEKIPEVRAADFLTSLLLGYEVGIRAGLIRHRTSRIYRSSGSWGTYAGVAAAGRLMGLSPSQLYHALGAAEYYAPMAPMMKCIEFPSMGKDSTGWACMAAACSVHMAARGFTCIPPLFDDSPDASLIHSLGEEWRIMDLYFKPYAGCRWAQPAINGALKIVADNRLSVDDMLQIKVFTFAEAAALPTVYPQNTEEAQYNFSFPIAAALLDGEVGPDQVMNKLASTRVRALMDKIVIVADDRFQVNFPERAESEVQVVTAKGEYFSGVVTARWDAHISPPSDKELEDKFLWLVVPVLGKAKAEKLITTIWQFEEQDIGTTFMALCIR